MTKTEARQLAKRATRYGYFKTGRTVSVNCPVCSERQSAEIGHATFPAPKGKPANVDPVTGKRTVFRLETDMEALDRVMIGHLTEWCGIDQTVH